MAEPVIIRNTQSPGDYIVLTSALRDIALQYPGRFRFYARTPQPQIFQANPHVAAHSPRGRRGVRQLVAKYSSKGNPYRIHKSNQNRTHFIWGFLGDLNLHLGVNAILTDFRPALYLTEAEKAEPPLNLDKPYWVFVSGGKRDFTAKWWDPACWQQVVNRMNKKVVMVQVGGGSHIHPRLQGAHDLVAKTSFRQLMRLIYHSHGVVCIVTCLMHIAAAFNKPCVVVGGGREPWWWEAYNEQTRLWNMREGKPDWKPPEKDTFVPHRYLHTIGQLDCCHNKGCWKARVEGSGSVCTDVVSQPSGLRLPHCLQMITPDMVVENMEWYYKEGILNLNKKFVLPPIDPAIDMGKIKPLAHAMETAAPPPPRTIAGMPKLAPSDDTKLDGVHLMVYVGGRSHTDYIKQVRERSPGAAISAVCNGKSETLLSWCGHNAVAAVAAANAPGRGVMMERAFSAAKRPRVVWLEYPVLPRMGYWARYLAALKDGEAGGVLYWRRLSEGQLRLAHAMPWSKTWKPQGHVLDGKLTAIYPARGMITFPQMSVGRVNWVCRKAPDTDVEVLMGVGFNQWNLKAYDLGHTVEHL